MSAASGQEFKSTVVSSFSEYFEKEGWKVEAGRVISGGYKLDLVLTRGERILAVEVEEDRKSAIDFVARTQNILRKPDVREVMAVLPSTEVDDDLLNLAVQTGCGLATVDADGKVEVLKWGATLPPDYGISFFYYYPPAVRKGQKFTYTVTLSNKSPRPVTACVLSLIQSYPFETIPGGTDRYAVDSVADGTLGAFTIPMKVADDAEKGVYSLLTKFERSGTDPKYHKVDVSVY